jgi:ribonuclease VapC
VIVLDSSAILAVLLAEPGARNVVSSFPEGVLSAASLAEILSKAQQKGINSEDAYDRIVAYGLRIVPVETQHARIAAKISLAPRELDLSLGDRLCIALALALKCELLTSDRGMLRLPVGIPIRSFR